MSIMIPAWQDGALVPMEKLMVHRLGLKHKAVSVFVFWQGKVLLQQRALEKYHSPGLWANTCCTHPDWDEPSNICAARRLKDEMGITGLSLKYAKTLEYRAKVGADMIEHEVVDCYVAHCIDEPHIDLNPNEVMDSVWITLEDLTSSIARSPNTYTEWLKIYVRDHYHSLFSHSQAETV